MMGLMSSSEVSFSIEIFSSGILFRDHIEGETLGGFIQYALRLLRFLQQIGDLARVATQVTTR